MVRKYYSQTFRNLPMIKTLKIRDSTYCRVLVTVHIFTHWQQEMGNEWMRRDSFFLQTILRVQEVKYCFSCLIGGSLSLKTSRLNCVFFLSLGPSGNGRSLKVKKKKVVRVISVSFLITRCLFSHRKYYTCMGLLNPLNPFH